MTGNDHYDMTTSTLEQLESDVWPTAVVRALKSGLELSSSIKAVWNQVVVDIAGT